MADLVAANISLDLSSALNAVILPDLPTEDPNELREYIVIVKKEYTIDQLEDDLRRDTAEDDGVDSSMVPDRPVTVANPREFSARQTHFMMTWAEANSLKNHPQVLGVELASAIITQTSSTRTQNFIKVGPGTANVGNATNYGLYRCNFTENIYGANAGGVAAMSQNLDGTGVDVVIMDNGVLVDHPEWEGPDGRNRFVQIDWYAAAGSSNTMPVGYYNTPTDGHGTCVASVVAGKTYGWATNANIYSMKTLGSGALLPPAEGLDLIRQWHLNKPINPNTGFRNPTIVNASWNSFSYVMGAAIGGNYDPYQGHFIYPGFTLFDGSYRGNVWDANTLGIGTYTLPKLEYALGTEVYLTGYNLGGANVTGNLYFISGNSVAIDDAVDSLVDAGVIFVHSAGNRQFKLDAPGGPDWDNYINILNTSAPLTFSTRYYCRPDSPWANNIIKVGAVDSDVYPADANLEQRAAYSNFGTSVDIHAPGTGIVGASSVASLDEEPYYANSSYFQINQQGTSFSAPQVAGVLALFAQAFPGVSPTEAKKWLLTRASTANVIYDTGLDDDYTDPLSLSGGPNKFLYNINNKANTTLSIADGATMTGTVLSNESTANITRV